MPTKPKTLLPKISKEHRIRFGNNHSHIMLITQKIIHFIKLIWEQHHQLAFATIVWYVIHIYISFVTNKQDTECSTV